jgi:tetratricopeptide (TPR) repeat protein
MPPGDPLPPDDAEPKVFRQTYEADSKQAAVAAEATFDSRQKTAAAGSDGAELKDRTIEALQTSMDSINHHNEWLREQLKTRWDPPKAALTAMIGVFVLLFAGNLYSQYTATSALKERSDYLQKEIDKSEIQTKASRDAVGDLTKKTEAAVKNQSESDEGLRQRMRQVEERVARQMSDVIGTARTVNAVLGDLNLGKQSFDRNDPQRAFLFATQAATAIDFMEARLEPKSELLASLEQIRPTVGILRVSSVWALGDVATAQRLADELLSADNKFVEAQHFAGITRLERAAEEFTDVHARRSRLDEAIGHLEIAVATDDKQNSDLILLAAANYDAGRYDDCTKYATRYLDGFPGSDMEHQRLSRNVQAYLVIGGVWHYLAALKRNPAYLGLVDGICQEPMPEALPIADAQVLDKLLVHAFSGFDNHKFVNDEQKSIYGNARAKTFEFLRGSAVHGCKPPKTPRAEPIPSAPARTKGA